MGKLKWKRDKEYSLFAMRFGGKAFLYVNMAQVVIGLWFLIVLPREQMLIFMGKNMLATILFALGFIATIVVLVLLSRSLRTDDPRKGVIWTVGITGAILVMMVIMRDALRSSYLSGVYDSNLFAVKTQWDVLIIFLVLFIGGILLWIQMMRRYFLQPKKL